MILPTGRIKLLTTIVNHAQSFSIRSCPHTAIMPVTSKELTSHADPQNVPTASLLLNMHFHANGRQMLSQELLQSSLDHAVVSNGAVIHQPNGLVHTLLKAYCSHHAVSIRPDDVWLAILTQFSFFVNANAEELQDKSWPRNIS